MRCIVLLLLVMVPAPAPAAIACGLYSYDARIIEVHDGNTVTAVIKLGFNTWLRGEKLRLDGIDAPEMSGMERSRGIVSRDRLSKRIQGKDVILRAAKNNTGKYCRYLVFVKDTTGSGKTNINQWMLNEGLAKIYE